MVVLERKKFKEFCPLRLNLLIKTSYIPDFKKKLSRGLKVMAKKKKIFVHFSKKIGVCKVNFFSKIYF